MQKIKVVAKRISGIGRPLSFKYPTNRAIIIIIALLFILGTFIKLAAGDSFFDSIVWSLGAAAALFFSWALARELDPDGNVSSFIATALMFVALFFVELPALLPLFWLLIIARILNRITGLFPKPLDLAGVLILAGVLSWQELWVYGLITALALYINYWMDEKKRKGIILGVTVLIFALLSAVLGNATLINTEISTLVIISVTVPSLFLIPIICTTTKVKSLTDVTGEPVSVVRLNVTRLVVLVTGILVTSIQGSDGFYNLLPLWAVIGGIIAWNYYKFIKH
jgi:hypothetical protein